MSLSYELSGEALLPLEEPLPEVKQARRTRNLQKAAVMSGLVLVDALALLFTFLFDYFLRFRVFGFLYVPANSPLRFYSDLVLWLIPAWLVVFSAYRLYDLKLLHGGTNEYRRIVSACTFSIIMLLGFSFFMDDKLIISRAWLLMVWVSSMGTIILGRFIVRRFLYVLRKKGLAMTRVLVVGANSETREMASQLMSGRNLPGVELVGFLGERRRKPRVIHNEVPPYHQDAPQTASWPGRWMGQVEEVRRVVDCEHIDEVIIVGTALSRDELLEVVRQLSTSKVEIRLSPSIYEILTTGMEVQEINGLPFVRINKVRITGLNAILKRSLDIAVAAGVLLALLPLWLVLALLVRLDSSGPVIYRRRVMGQGGKLFDAFKFRTMRLDGDALLEARPDLKEELYRTGKLKEDPRITRVGKFLRKTSLDEIPQLINVLVGQMSLVGPRMITYQEMIKFGRWQSNLITVKPGLTGLWQVSGRSNLTYEDRVRLDMHYIRTYSIWVDLQILFQTVPAVLRGSGAY